jgi:hypothetical protein
VLRIQSKRLPYIRSLDEQNQYVASIKQRIEQHIRHFGNQNLQQFVDTNGYFAHPDSDAINIPCESNNNARISTESTANPQGANPCMK